MGTTLEFYSLFITIVSIAVVYELTSPELSEIPGFYYNAVCYAALALCTAFVCCMCTVLLKGENENTDTEDHYYVEGLSRFSIVVTFVAWFLLSIVFNYYMLPLHNGKITSGVETFTAFYKETTTWRIIACNLAGIVAGLCICLLTEYFTS